jgi:uncharacterized protein (DUF736 family)
MIIGNFQQNDGRFVGTIKTLTFETEAVIEPIEKRGDKRPDYCITSDDAEIGAAWKKTSREGAQYLSVSLDDPSFAASVNASLVKSGAELGHTLYWDRPSPQKTEK